MKRNQLEIGVLTSSRADFGIYLPLLRAIKEDKDLELSIIAFGTHLSPFHGLTKTEIESHGFSAKYLIESMLQSDSSNAISTATSLTMMKFSDFWKQYSDELDLVFCLGDRYEMFGAVLAGLPYGIRFAHIHGGETTLGAIDNVYRHSISLASEVHFSSTEVYAQKIYEITKSSKIHNVGSLSLDNLETMEILDIEGMIKHFNVDFSTPSILATVHPETVASGQNHNFASECKKAFQMLAKKFQLVITMPNADTLGTVYRNEFEDLFRSCPDRIKLIENFGTQGYFSAMKHAKFLIGNTSSGIIEAASFGKFVINLGDRQKGRVQSENITDCPFDSEQIVDEAMRVSRGGSYKGDNKYYFGGAVKRILTVIKEV